MINSPLEPRQKTAGTRSLFFAARRALTAFPLLVLATALHAGAKLEMNPPRPPPAGNVVGIVGATLIDGRGGPPVRDSVVLIEGSRIIAAGPRTAVRIPGAASILEAQGLSVLPGLIDVHFHSRDNTRTPVEFELHRGITSFRDPGHPFRYYEQALKFPGVMPRIFLCGAHLDAAPPAWPDQAIVIADAAHARRTVYEHVAAGASAIKTYFRLPLDHLAATCEAAHERGVLVTAHLELVDADAAIRAGVRGIEHVTSFGTALAEPADVARFKAGVSADSAQRNQLRHWLWSRIDLAAPRVPPLLALLKREGVFVTPTLALFEARDGAKGGTAERQRGFETMRRFIGLCHAAGVRLVVGSHTAVPFAATGRAYQREIELLVAAGLSPLEAITAGTRRGAEFLGIEDRLGTIEPGQIGDLLLVAGDPTADIRALDDVRHVMLNGTWVALPPRLSAPAIAR